MTPTAGKATRVRFLRGGVVLAQAVVPGMLLELDLPKSVTITRSGTHVDLIESPDPALECCGDVILPWASRQAVGTERLRVDAPPPFSNSDLRVMWEARNRLRERHRPPTSGAAPWAVLQPERHPGLAWRELRRAVEAATHLLATWPTRPIPATAWLPLERPGPRLLVSVTERHVKHHAVVVPHGIAPTQTARRLTTREEHRLHGLSALATLVAERISAYPGLDALPGLRRDLTGLFRRVAVRSRPARPTTDPPPSTWPASMASAYVACLRAVTAMRDEGGGQATAPMSELWELYQAWAADDLLRRLTEILGQPDAGSAQGTSLAQWTDGAGTVELRYQPFVPGAADTRGAAFLGVRLLAVIGNLQPDLLLIRREHETWRAVVVDAKKRSGALPVDELSVAASKYLWGIRRASSKAVVPAVAGVILAAPLGGAGAGHAEGLAAVMQAHPATGCAYGDVVALLDLVRGTPARAVASP